MSTAKPRVELFETLETRRMMDATQYVIQGTPGNDVITVQTVVPLVSGFRLGGDGRLGDLGGKIGSQVKITVNGISRTADVPTSQTIRIEGLAGNDLIRVIGKRGMWLMGNEGTDTLVGGTGPDLLAGGMGSDTVDYSARLATVVITPDNQADDGAGGEHDNVYSDCETILGGQGNDYIGAWAINYVGRTIYGNQGNDTLLGSSANDVILGGGGNDYIDGAAGLDYIDGEAGNDTVHGGADRDVIAGGSGNDAMYADSGADAVFGNDGDDRLYSGRDNDELLGGRGRDTLVSLGGGQRDKLNGGSDLDTFWLDSESTETIPDYDFYTESKNFHRVARFDNLHVDGVDMGAPSRELTGQRLPDPKADFIYRNFSGKPLFSTDGPRANDVQQGDRADDCYFLAGLAAVAQVKPEALKQNVVDLGDGTFAVRFMDGPATGQQITHYLRVDADLSTYGDGSPAYAGLGAQNSLWVAILEKAWAFYRGGLGNYSATGFGDPGELYKSLGFVWSDNRTTTADAMHDRLAQLLAQGKAVTVSTKASATAMVHRHVYTVYRTFTSNGTRYVTLRNPWGHDTNDPAGDPTNDGYVTVTAATLFSSITKAESATVA